MKHATFIILAGMGAMMLIGTASSARAGNLLSDSYSPSAFSAPGETATLGDWAPYGSEFSEVCGYLKNRIGWQTANAVRQPINGTNESIEQSNSQVPSQLPFSWVKRDIQKADCQESSMGTSGSSVERPTTPQVCISEILNMHDSVIVTFLQIENYAFQVPSQISGLFRPPRSKHL
jgi:hypothetical protein